MLYKNIRRNRGFGLKTTWSSTIWALILGILFMISPILIEAFMPSEPLRHVEIAEVSMSSTFSTLPDGTQIRFQTVESENGETFVPVEIGYPGKTRIYKIYPEKESAIDVGKYQIMVFRKHAESVDLGYTVLYVSIYK